MFPDGTQAVDGLDLEIADGELHRPRRAVGLGQVDGAADGRRARGRDVAATIRSADRVVNDVAPKDRDIAMVFQSYALYPHMSVEDNLGFALKMQQVERPSIRERVGAVARAARDRRAARAAPARAVAAASASGSRWGARSCARRRRS